MPKMQNRREVRNDITKGIFANFMFHTVLNLIAFTFTKQSLVSKTPKTVVSLTKSKYDSKAFAFKSSFHRKEALGRKGI